MIGCGQVVERFHLPALAAAPGVALSCAVEQSAERRRAMAPRLGDATLHEELDQALDAGAADAALIATPPSTHAELAARCLAAGWHVLVEKPMAATVADALRIVDAATRAERRVAVGFNRRFRRSWRSARRLLAGADPGTVGEASLTMAFDTERWRAAAALGHEQSALAGLLDDVVPHQVDLLAFLFGSPIERVRAEDVRFRRGRSVELDYAVETRRGVAVSCRAAHLPRHEELLEATVGGRRLVADPHGARWSGSMEPLRRRIADLGAQAAHAGRRVAGRPTATSASFAAQLEAFARAVRLEPADDLAGGSAGLAACAAGDALRASVRGAGLAWTTVERQTA